MTTPSPRLERTLGWGILLLLGVGCLLIVLPFLSAILWAVVLCFTCWPIYMRLLRAMKGRRTFAAAIITLGMIVIMLLPVVLVGARMADNAKDLGVAIQHWRDEGAFGPPTWLDKVPLIGHWATNYWQSLADDSSQFAQFAKNLAPGATAALIKLGLILGNGLLELALSIFVAFFLFRDGTAAAEVLKAVVQRIAGDRGNRYLTVAGDTVRGVVYGILGTAFVQATIAGIGFLIAGVPGPALLALLTFFLSVLPVGPPLIWIPATIWLYHRGHVGWAIFMLIWGIGVSSVDNVVKPWLISKGVRMPFVLIFFGVIGGALQFGFIGVFLGPTMLAVAYRMVQEWVPKAHEPLDSPAAAP